MKPTVLSHGTRVVEVCPTCGIPRSEWPDAGIVVSGSLYCCRDCADGVVCGCREHGARKLVEEQRSCS